MHLCSNMDAIICGEFLAFVATKYILSEVHEQPRSLWLDETNGICILRGEILDEMKTQ